MKKQIVILFVFFYFLTISCLYGGGTTAEFLRLNPSAKSAGSANSMFIANNTADSIFFNPAGLSGVKGNSLSASYSLWFQDVKFGSLAFSMPVKAGKVGVSYLNLAGARVEKRDADGNLLSGFSTVSESVFILSYALDTWKNIPIGASVKFINQNHAEISGSGFAFDVGGLYKFIDGSTFTGISIQNAGQKIREQNLPLNIRVGAAHNLNTVPLTLLAEFEYPTHLYLKPKLGAEYRFSKFHTSFRLGYEWIRGLSTAGDFSFGFGFKIPVLPKEALLPENVIRQRADVSLDYAVTDMDALGIVQRMTVGIEF